MATALELLKCKEGSGPRIVTIPEGVMVREAADRMNTHHIGALMVVDGAMSPVGIFTERDLLKRVVAEGRRPEETPVRDVMTRDVYYCGPQARINDLREAMRSRRIRHVPIVDEGRQLLGMVSIGDLNAAQVRELSDTIVYLEEFIQRS